MDESSNFKKRMWMVVGVLWLVACLNYLDRLMITTMRDPIKASIAMTDAQFGLLTSVFLWVYGILSPFAGYLADRFSRSRVIVGSLLVWSIVTWLTGHVTTFNQLLVARALMGISEACYIPAALALINDYHGGRTRSLATGLHMSGVYAGAALGGMGGVIAEHFSWRIGFSVFGIFGIVYAIFMAFVLRDVPVQANPQNNAALGGTANDKVNALSALKALFKQPAFCLLMILNALFGVANWGINGWLPTFLKERFHLGLGHAGMSATGYIQVASFIGVILGGTWADWWSRTNKRGRVLVPAIGFLLAGPCLFLAAGAQALAAAIAGLIVYGLARGFFDANLMPVVRQVADQRYSATGYGFLNFISCMTGGVMIYAGGVLKDAQIDLARVFQFSAAGLLVAAILLFFVKPKA